MFSFLKLIRLHTLAFAAFTMYAMRFFVIKPLLDINGFSLQMSDIAFTALVIAVCCLISAAYVINDYFDTKTDRISGVRDLVVGKSVSRRMAISLHTMLNVIAVAIAFYLSFAVGIWKIGILFLLISGLLWFYSSYYKRIFILGYVIAGILVALLPLSTVLYEIPLLNMAYADILLETDTNFMYIFNWILGFSFFLFWNMIMYEMNKDLYTIEGDRENGIQTVPVRFGREKSGYIIAGLAGTCICVVLVLYGTVFSASLLILIYMAGALIFPYLLYIVLIMRKSGNRKQQIYLIRLIMVLCIGFSMLLNHFFQMLFAE